MQQEKATHKVIDEIIKREEDREIFRESSQDCYKFVHEQGCNGILLKVKKI